MGGESGEVVFDSSDGVTAQRLAAQAELNPAAGSAVSAAAEGIAMELSAEFEGVLSAHVRNVIYELDAGIGPLNFGPVKAAEFVGKDIEAANVDARQASIEWVGHPGVQTVRRCGNRVVIRKRWLIKAVVAEAGFIDSIGIGNIVPILPNDLGTRVDQCQPLRL